MQFNMFNGVIGVLIFALDVWAIASIINSGATGGKKILWVIIVAILPVLGLILWWLMGPKANYNQRL